MNNSEEYRKLLIEEIEATGKYLLENAKKMVKDVDFICDLDINLNFPSKNDTGSCPTITIQQVCINDSAIKVEKNKFSENSSVKHNYIPDHEHLKNPNPSFGVQMIHDLGKYVGEKYDEVFNNDQT